ncbi:hypothetical protein [Zooshikella harenae]|uniref:Uncharacterized protein n=1 Tax=Zooshikella harenae TaxID=2827238 RepID=A0ABS5ZE15_9GAMM|nr:hypothetical protein [Zooshikella harenae]MBU2712210.1 hypothetical protein [Zooshikella harenae]
MSNCLPHGCGKQDFIAKCMLGGISNLFVMKGEYARIEGGDGFHEVHVNTVEGCWLLLLLIEGFIEAYRKRNCL